MNEDPHRMTSQAISISMIDTDEESLAIRHAKKDMTLFEPLYEKYYGRVFRFIAARVDDIDDAGDICSASFLKAMQSLWKYEDRGLPFGAWLFRIALNEVNQFYRRRNSRRIITLDVENIRDIGESVEEIDKEEAMRQMEEAIQELEPRDIELLQMKFYEKRSYEEISLLLGQTVTNLKVRVHRIKTKIRNTVQQNNMEG